MKKIILFCFLFLAYSFSVAQSEQTKTILYLIPLDADNMKNVNINEIKDQNGLEANYSHTLIGFWEGAQIALDELAKGGKTLNVISRDITDDETKLESILSDPAIQKVDLIIAPVFGKMFPAIAEFAKLHKIPLVNPFSSRQDIIDNNPYVYKLSPAWESRPQIINEVYPNSNFILWGNDEQYENEIAAYEEYFKLNKITYHKISDTAFIDKKLSQHLRNVVITFFDKPKQITQAMSKMLSKNISNFQWVVPESWLKINHFNIENANIFKLNFFTNYFVDEKDELTKVFIYNFASKFEHLPSTENFAYQGYDITKFFVDLICNDFNIPQNEPFPLACRFKFKRIEKGGFENIQTRLIQIDNYKFNVIK